MNTGRYSHHLQSTVKGLFFDQTINGNQDVLTGLSNLPYASPLGQVVDSGMTYVTKKSSRIKVTQVMTYESYMCC